jgi:hypothetical protein
VPNPPSDLPSLSISKPKTKISRRLFGQHAALAAAFSLSPAELLATPHHSHPDPQSNSELTPEQAQEVEAKFANVIRKYDSRLSEDQRKRLRRILTYNERMLASVRSFPLENGDPPASVLRVSFSESTQKSGAARSAPAGTEGKP